MADRLGARYGRQAVLDGIDLRLDPGETLALLGPNGAGKSTLLRIAAGLAAPAHGTLLVRGCDPARDRRARRGIGWVPQRTALYPHLTVLENLRVFGRLAGLPRRQRRQAIAEVLDRAGLARQAGIRVGRLSGGYQRRVTVATSLLARPALLLLDEPSSGIDLEAREAIHVLLAELRAAGLGIVVATHDFAEAERLADRVLFLAGGRVVGGGVLASLLASLRETQPLLCELVLTSVPDTASCARLRHEGFVPGDAPLLWRADASRPWPGQAPGLAPGLADASVLTGLRRHGIPAGELRLRTPGLQALYVAALAGELRGSAPAPGVPS